MKLKFLIFATLLAAMGPAREAPPQAVPQPDPPAPMSPEEMPDSAPAPAAAAELIERDAAQASPGDFRWKSRPVVIFADTAEDPAFREQIQALRRRPGMLLDRDVIVVTDTDPGANGEWRRLLRPRGFSLVVMDKDGQVKLRKPFPWDVREISRAIDKFPLRLQEIGRTGMSP